MNTENRAKMKNPQINYQFNYGSPRRLLGQILLDGEFIHYNDLEQALEEQKQTNRLLGETLVHMGLLDPLDLKAVLSVNEDLASLKDAVQLAAGVRKLLGELFLQSKHITSQELDLALQVQKRTDEKLGKVLMRLGFVTDGELNEVLQFQQNQDFETVTSGRLRLGEILVATNQITRSQLDNALVQQKISKIKIGEILVKSGYINLHQLSHGLKLQSKLLTAALVTVLSLAPISNI